MFIDIFLLFLFYSLCTVPLLSFVFLQLSKFALSYLREGTSLRINGKKKECNRKHNRTEMKYISFHLWWVFLWIHHLIRAEEIIYCIYLWLPVGVAVTLHVHASFGGGVGGGGGLVHTGVGRLGMVDWVKWTVTTIWFAFTWSSCFPYFPFVCSPGSSPVWEESDVMLLRKHPVFNYIHYHYCYQQQQHQRLIYFPLFSRWNLNWKPRALDINS